MGGNEFGVAAGRGADQWVGARGRGGWCMSACVGAGGALPWRHDGSSCQHLYRPGFHFPFQQTLNEGISDSAIFSPARGALGDGGDGGGGARVARERR